MIQRSANTSGRMVGATVPAVGVILLKCDSIHDACAARERLHPDAQVGRPLDHPIGQCPRALVHAEVGHSVGITGAFVFRAILDYREPRALVESGTTWRVVPPFLLT